MVYKVIDLGPIKVFLEYEDEVLIKSHKYNSEKLTWETTVYKNYKQVKE
jgi:hypothetical protein